MKPGILLDTHVLVRWLAGGSRLTKEQVRILSTAGKRNESFGLSAMTLLELALLGKAGSTRLPMQAEQVFQVVESNPSFFVIPITVEIAREVSRIYPALHDPADAAIVATARVHGLRLVTCDQRIIESNVVSTVG